MGKGPDAANGGGVVAVEDLKGDEVESRHGRGIGKPDQTETFGRSTILTSPSWLVNVSAENPMRSVSYTETVP
jgi:hypothetical protein